LADVQARVEAGYQEAVLTGVHIRRLWRDADGNGAWTWWGWWRAPCGDGVGRLRLSSISRGTLPEQALAVGGRALCRICTCRCRAAAMPSCTAWRVTRPPSLQRGADGARAAIPDLAGDHRHHRRLSRARRTSSLPKTWAFSRRSALPGLTSSLFGRRDCGGRAATGRWPVRVKAERARPMRPSAAARRAGRSASGLWGTMEVLWELAGLGKTARCGAG